MDVKCLAGARQVAVVAEVGLEGVDQLGAMLFVVVQDRSDGALHERYDVTSVAPSPPRPSASSVSRQRRASRRAAGTCSGRSIVADAPAVTGADNAPAS